MNIVPSTSSLQTTLPNLKTTSENKAIIAETIQVLESLNLDKEFKPIKAAHVINHTDPLYQHLDKHISSNRMDPPPPPPPPPRPPTPPYSASDYSALFKTHRTATRVLNGNGNSSRGGNNPPRGGGHAGRGGSNPPRGGGHAGRGGSNPPRGGGHSGRGGSNPPRGGGHSGRGGSYATRGRS